jgi:hypothetical protein
LRLQPWWGWSGIGQGCSVKISTSKFGIHTFVRSTLPCERVPTFGERKNRKKQGDEDVLAGISVRVSYAPASRSDLRDGKYNWVSSLGRRGRVPDVVDRLVELYRGGL